MTEPTADEPEIEGFGGRRPRPRWLASIAVATAVLAGSAGVGLWLARGEDLPRKPPEIITILPSMSPGKTEFSVGLDIVDKGKDIEILEVTARTTANVEFLGANAIWPRDLDPKYGQPGAGESGWPAGPHGRHSVDAVVPAAELMFEPKGFGAPGDLFVQAGYRLTSGDLGGLLGLRVRYKLGGKTKSEYYPWGVVVCVKPHRCGGAGVVKKRPGDQNFYKRAFMDLGLLPRGAYKDID